MCFSKEDSETACRTQCPFCDSLLTHTRLGVPGRLGHRHHKLGKGNTYYQVFFLKMKMAL